MRKAFVVLVCFICIPVFLVGCVRSRSSDAEIIKDLQNQVEDLQAQLDAQTENVPTQALPDQSEAPVASATPSPTPSLLPAPSTPAMYDSDALFVSFDPGTGIAQFDYIEILQGNDAVQYMVTYQGKTLQEAQDIVENWADSECIVKNHNSQLRSIDMNGPAIKMLCYPNGDEDYSLNGISFSYQDFVTLYTNHPDKVDCYLFYHIDVNSAGNVVEVKQVYWP